MAQFRVGCVPYVNARPLVAVFDQPNEFVEVLYAVPSKLPAMLDSGEVDAILVSSIELLRRDDLLPVTEVGIMSNGPVMSVRMLSKVPLSEIKTLALDQSSMTSNMLAQVILAEQGVFPKVEEVPPVASDMLANHDACVLIGDRGFEADGTGLVDIDLGEAWTKMTGLPFVWALWLGKRDRPIRFSLLGQCLRLAYDLSGFSSLHLELDSGDYLALSEERRNRLIGLINDQSPRRKYVIESAVRRSTWSSEQVENYLSKGVRFFQRDADDALDKFTELIQKHKFASVRLPLEMRPDDLYDELSGFMPPAPKISNSSLVGITRKAKPLPGIDWVPFQSLEGMVRLALITNWDPIGVFGYPGTLDEYDNYVPEIVELLNQKASAQDMERSLRSLAESKMGVHLTENQLKINASTSKKLIDVASHFQN